MCDEGRYGWKHVHDATPPERAAKQRDEQRTFTLEWPQLSPRTRDRSDSRKAGRLAAVFSPHLTVEEAYLLAKYIRGLDAEAIAGGGARAGEGEDESFPNGFTIRAEKCPNRRGVEKVARALHGGTLVTSRSSSTALDERTSAASGFPAATRHDWNDAAMAEKFAGVKTLVVQDCSPRHCGSGPLQLPGAAFAERDGSYVNSRRSAAIVPLGRFARRRECKTEAQLFWQLQADGPVQLPASAGRGGREIGYFCGCDRAVSEYGVDLKVNLLAGASRKRSSHANANTDALKLLHRSHGQDRHDDRRSDDRRGVLRAARTAGWPPGCRIASGRTASACRSLIG